MTDHERSVRRSASSAAIAAALTLTAAACSSTTSTPNSGTTSHTFPTLSATPSGTGASESVADPACTAALDALQTEGQNLASNLNDLPSAQSIAGDLKAKLDSAAAQAASTTVKDAITTLSGDFGTLAQALAAGDHNAVQKGIAKDASDAAALVKACKAAG